MHFKNNVFTTAAMDNIRHNPSSTTAKDSFHGTSLSLFQHPTLENKGPDRPAVRYVERPVITKTVTPLPDFYVSIPPVVLRNAEPKIPQHKQVPKSSTESLHDVIKVETEWFNTVKENNENETKPLFAIVKQIQWTWPDLYGEDKIVIMFGGLHVEKTVLIVLGKLLEGSGWTEALTQVNVHNIRNSRVTSQVYPHYKSSSSSPDYCLFSVYPLKKNSQ